MSMRVLLIEDDAATRGYVARGLAEAGHVVDTAADGREGLMMALFPMAVLTVFAVVCQWYGLKSFQRILESR